MKKQPEPADAPLTQEKVCRSVNVFLRWLEREGCESYDPYDLWGTAYGVFARRTYYNNAALGLPLIAPILLMEMIWPQWRGLWVGKHRYATADAQLLLAFLNLYELTGQQKFLDKAINLGRDLVDSSIPGYSGHCWGYPFDWQHNRGLWKRNIPFITATPYCFEAFLGLYDVTAERRFLETAQSIARFVSDDLRDTPTRPDAAAASYSPIDDSLVINASAYRAMVLFEAAHRFSNQQYRQTAQRNLNFILESQRADGAWLYALDHPADQFIDHFHTCFVLKNLYKLNRRLQSGTVSRAIADGFRYYRYQLFNLDGLPRQFALKPRAQTVRLELYDVAEAITLGSLLRPDFPEAFALAQRLALLAGTEYQLADGHFVTRVYLAGVKHTLPFLRWPQAQLFYALTNFLLALRKDSPRTMADSRQNVSNDGVRP